MIEQTREERIGMGRQIDPFTIIRDVARHWMIIVLLALSASLLSYIVVSKRYSPTYTVRASYVVNQKESAYAYSDLSVAKDTAEKLGSILQSSILQKKVCEDLGLLWFSGTATAEVVPETNILTVSMTASSPDMAFRLLDSTMKNHNVVSKYLLNNVVLESLESPIIPTSPDVPLNASSAMKRVFLLVAAGLIGIYGIASFLRDTIRTEADGKNKLDAELVGLIYHENRYKTWKEKMSRPKRSILITKTATSFRYVETLRKLAMNIKMQADQKGCKTILISSVLENEGKSTVAANIALALAQEGKKVLLMDCDFRKPAQHKIFEWKKGTFGEIGESICGREQEMPLIGQDSQTGLYFLIGSKMYPDSTEMIGSDRFRGMLSYLKEKMDYVIMDSSPMALVADTEELNEFVDASILVVRQHTALVQDINDSIDVLNAGNSHFLGYIINDFHQDIREVVGQYSYGYGYGYGYGNYGYYNRRAGGGHGKQDRV